MQIHITGSINGLSLPVCRSPFCASKLYIPLILTMLSLADTSSTDGNPLRTHKSLKSGESPSFLPIISDSPFPPSPYGLSFFYKWRTRFCTSTVAIKQVPSSFQTRTRVPEAPPVISTFLLPRLKFQADSYSHL